MSSKIFNVGDVVMLKSGSELMTIDEITQKFDDGIPLDEFNCKCVWFVNSNSKSEWFSQFSLQKVENSGPSKVFFS